MLTLRQKLDELLKEKKARAEACLINQTTTRKERSILKKESSKSWKEKREHWSKHYKEHPGFEAPAGELANMIDGLTPDGYDKKGRKLSFVERGRSDNRLAE